MPLFPSSPYLQQLRDRITLEEHAPELLEPRFGRSPADGQRIPFSGIPFSDRGSRIHLFRRASTLYIRLAERWSKWVEEVGDYRLRAPVIADFVFTDVDRAPLDFTFNADSHALGFSTRLGDCWLAFADEETLYFKLPAGRMGISFRAKTLELLMRPDDIYEYYNPDTGDPPPHAASVFGWSSAVFVDLAIQAARLRAADLASTPTSPAPGHLP